MTDKSLLDWALSYAKRGIPVFPLAPRDKVPLLSSAEGGHGHQDATCDQEKIRAWWKREPRANIGAPTGSRSGFSVFDVDRKNGGTEKLAEKFQADPDCLPPTIEVKTGGGGKHFYFRTPKESLGSASAIGGIAGWDYKEEGGYVVLPPSIHESGGVYAFEGAKIKLDELEAIPDWILALRRQSNGATQVKLAEVPLRIAKGERNAVLIRFAGAYRRVGETREEIAAHLQIINRSRCEEPLDDDEIAGLARSVTRYTPEDPITNGEAPDESEGFTDLGNSEVFARLFRDSMRYAIDMETWFQWDKRHWGLAHTAEVLRSGRAVPEERLRVAEAMPRGAKRSGEETNRERALSFAKKCESLSTIRACVELATSEKSLGIWSRSLDTDPMRFACANGELDLRTGRLEPHDPSHLLTLLSPIAFEPDATCPQWEQYLADVFLDDQELIGFVQRACGYSLTGQTIEQKFFVLYNSGANGKSTFINILSAVMGDHARTTQFDVFLAQKRDSSAASPDLAALRGARVVTATEPDAGARLSESIIKQMTGRDPISCRELHKGIFQYIPQFKLWLSANHKPVIRGTDHGIWRRPLMIPFDATFKDSLQQGDSEDRVKIRDKAIEDKLRAELPGILAWCVRGCLEWQRVGLGSCSRVDAATIEYRKECDVMGNFLDERTVKGDHLDVAAAQLYQAWCEWAKAGGEYVMTQTAFGRSMEERGFRKFRDSTGTRCYRGLMVTPSDGIVPTPPPF